MSESEKQIVFRAPAELVDRIAAEAQARGISRNLLTVMMLREALDALAPPSEMRATRLRGRPAVSFPLGPVIGGPVIGAAPAVAAEAER